jgi:hypothetical protein
MRLRFPVIIMAALAAMSAPLAVSAKDPKNSPTMSGADKVQVMRALNRGQLMYAYDQAAWHGTDDMREKLADYATRVEGWVVDGPADAPHLIFYSRDKDSPKGVYVADFRGDKLASSKVLGPRDDATLTSNQLKLIDARRRARDTMIKAGLGFCANAAPNSIILPPETPEGPYLDYFMTPQTRKESVPLGGHFLFEVSADGEVSAPRAFTKSCMEMPVKGAKKGVEALVVSHLLDPTPTEVHVFTTFAAGLPIFVMTTQNNRTWATGIDNGRATIRLVDAKK